MLKRNFLHTSTRQQAQTAIEYMLLLAVVVSVAMVAFKLYMPRIHEASNLYYNRAAVGVLGKPPACGDRTCSGFESQETCCVDCGGCTTPVAP